MLLVGTAPVVGDSIAVMRVDHPKVAAGEVGRLVVLRRYVSIGPSIWTASSRELTRLIVAVFGRS